MEFLRANREFKPVARHQTFKTVILAGTNCDKTARLKLLKGCRQKAANYASVPLNAS